MERLQKTVQLNPQPMTSPSICAKEAYGYAGNQGSPIPGETASPQSYFQHSPSLPASGLTEFNDIGSTTWDKPRELPAVRRDLTLTAGALQKQYVGVRVRMPVCELLRKIRLSKGMDSSNDKETSVKAGTKMTSGTTEKRRAYSEKRNKKNRRPTPPAALKSVEDLDILVEVLEEDLNKSHSKLGLQLPMPRRPDASAEFQLPCLEADGSPQPESRWESAGIQPHFPFLSSGALAPPNAENLDGFDCRTIQQRLDPSNIFQNSYEEERHQQGNGAVVHSAASFQGFARDLIRPHYHNTSGTTMPEPLEDGTATMYDGGQLKPNTRSSVRQNTSFFQFQLCREESWLRTISADRLIAPDKSGNRLLHEAVTQGKRALTYALAWRFASLNRIDEKDAAKQTALHLAAQKNHHLIASDLISLGANINARDSSEKTPLHLCAEKGYLKVLEVLKNGQEGGIRVDVDATDNQGLTPLQCAVFAHSTLSTDLKNRNLSPEARKVQNLRKDQLLSGIDCLVQMGADPWAQGAKSSSQVSTYLAKVQEDNELMSFFQAHRPKQQEDSGSLPGPERMALLYLQGEDVEPSMIPFPSAFDHFPDSAV